MTATKPGPEHQIEAAAATGDLVDLRTGTPQHDDPANGVDWDAARTVGAGLLASLLTASGKPDASRHRAIKIRGARITGSLDLQGLILACPLLLQDCHIDQPVDLSDSTAPSISLSGCHVPALAAGHLSTSGNLRLSDGFTAHNWVDLTYARIGGLLDFCKARLDGGLWASGLTVGQSLDCRNFSVTGSMNLTSASIRLQVNLGGATLDNPGGRALDAGGLSVGAGLLCRKAQDTGTRFTARGEVFLTRSRIGSQLDLSGAVLANERGQALTATGVTAEGGMVCGEEFTARGEVNLAGARLGLLDLSGAILDNPGGRALSAGALTVDQDMSCREGFAARGEVCMSGAHIGGHFYLDGATLANPDSAALSAYRLRVDGNVSCTDGFTARGEMSLAGSRIGGGLYMDGASLAGKRGPAPADRPARALTASGLTVGKVMSCRAGFAAYGGVVLRAARFGELNLDGAYLANEHGWALVGDKLVVEQDLSCRNLFALGTVSLVQASVGSRMDFSSAHLINPEGWAVIALGLRAGQGMLGSITARGEVNLVGAEVGGLSLNGASLANEHGSALSGGGLVVQELDCRDGFTAIGEVGLPYARVGHLDLSGASLMAHERGQALAAGGLRVGQHMFCREGFTACGNVDLVGAHIGGFLDFEGARLVNRDGAVLSFDHADAAGLDLRPQQSPEGVVDLTFAKVGAFIDDPATWPKTLQLRGFSYDSLENDRVSVRERLRWLTLDPDGYIPQIYDLLAACYRREGNANAARQVAVAKQWRHRRAFSPLNWLWYLTVGYGYRTWLAGLWLIGLTALGTVLFSHAYPRHLVRVPGHRETFSPFGYTLDVLLPIVDLGQASSWTPLGYAMYLSWGLAIAGWVLATVVIAGLTNVLKRD